MSKLILTVLSLFMTVVAGAQNVSVCKYLGDRQAAVSLAYDNGLLEHYTLVALEQEKRGMRGTFGIIGSMAGVENTKSATKVLNIIGDSYVENHRCPKEETWHYKMAKALGMTYNNYGKNGACVAFDRTHDGRFNFGPAMYAKTRQMNPDADYVIIIGGHNDAFKVGERKDSLKMFRDSLELLIGNIQEQCPHARIGYVTPWYCDNPGFKQVCKTIRKVCRRHGIPVLDNYSARCVIKVRDAEFRKRYFQKPNDSAHLNNAGHDLFLPVGMEWFDKTMR